MDRTSRGRTVVIAVVAALLVTITAACSGEARKDDAERRNEAETEPERNG
jgi:hypothetical protein